MVLLPFILLALGSDIGLLLAHPYEGLLLPVMALVWCLLFFVGWLAVYVALLGVLSLLVDSKKPVDRPTPFYLAVARYTLKLLLTLSRVQVRLEGGEKIPVSGRWLLVSNHRSAFDALAMIAALDRQELAFISKPSNMKLPIFGPLARKICCLALDRENDRAALKTILRAAELLKNDATSFGVYPEGHRNDGPGLLPFRNGAFKIAQKAKVPIVVVTTENSDMVRKNFPLRRTEIVLRVRRVLSVEQVLGMKTVEIGEEVRRCMLCASD